MFTCCRLSCILFSIHHFPTVLFLDELYLTSLLQDASVGLRGLSHVLA